MKIVSYKAIITGKGVRDIYDSNKQEIFFEKESEKSNNCKK